MRFRYLLVIFAVVFGATLAVIVGETLSSEAMSVMVGVVAGVGASIPTSLLIMWFALRAAELRTAAAGPVTYPMEPPEPRIVVVAPPMQRAAPPPAPPGYAAYAPNGAAYGYEQAPGYGQAPALPAPVPQRRFTVVDGYQAAPDGWVTGEPLYEEVAWQR
jgi:hypothetical protein